MAAKLTPTQQRAIEQLYAHGGRLVRRAGGFWTYDGCANEAGRGDVPEWWIDVRTVRVLERVGLLARANEHGDEWRDTRVLVVPGVKAGKMFTQEKHMGCTTRTIITAVALLLIAASAQAQSLVKQVLTDPTTYAPALTFYVGDRMDWQSSQLYFAHGAMEQNPGFTVSGRANDAPVSETEGMRRIALDTAQVFATSLVNNTVERLLERRHTTSKAWHILGFVERVAVASAMTYVDTSQHFEQWRKNVDGATAHGYTVASW